MEKYYLANLERILRNNKKYQKTILTDSTLGFIDFICDYQCERCTEENCPKS